MDLLLLLNVETATWRIKYRTTFIVECSGSHMEDKYGTTFIVECSGSYIEDKYGSIYFYC